MCEACAIMADDMHLMQDVIRDSRDPDIVEEVCNTLGYNHTPYAWIEDYCEEITEDYSSQLIHALQQRRDALAKGNSYSLREHICNNILDCKHHEL